MERYGEIQMNCGCGKRAWYWKGNSEERVHMCDDCLTPGVLEFIGGDENADMGEYWVAGKHFLER